MPRFARKSPRWPPPPHGTSGAGRRSITMSPVCECTFTYTCTWTCHPHSHSHPNNEWWHFAKIHMHLRASGLIMYSYVSTSFHHRALLVPVSFLSPSSSFSVMDVEGSEGNFFRAIVNIRRHDFPTARVCIDRARHLLDAELQACYGGNAAVDVLSWGIFRNMFRLFWDRDTCCANTIYLHFPNPRSSLHIIGLFCFQ